MEGWDYDNWKYDEDDEISDEDETGYSAYLDNLETSSKGVMTMDDEETKQQDETEFKQWCIVELMGKTMTAGLVTTQNIGGTPFVRVDVPAVTTKNGLGRDGFTKFYNPKAIYAITPVTEEVVELAVLNSRPVPVDPWTLRHAIAVDDDEAPF